MSFKFTPYTLQKIEHIFTDIDYVLRYEKGNFQSGFCMLEHQHVAVVNKFLTIENKINALIDILTQLDIDENALSEECKKTFKQVQQLMQKKEVFIEEVLF